MVLIFINFKIATWHHYCAFRTGFSSRLRCLHLGVTGALGIQVILVITGDLWINLAAKVEVSNTSVLWYSAWPAPEVQISHKSRITTAIPLETSQP